MARFAAFIVNQYGAPHLSELTQCGAPELDEPKNYLGSLLLNQLFVVKYPEPIKRLTIMFGRRADNGVREYRTGRELLKSYLDRLSQGNDHFLVALRATTHFENCIGSVSHAAALLNRLTVLAVVPDPSGLTDGHDSEERIRKIWNRAKHFDEDIMSSTAAPEKITAPVWLTNTGVSAETATITWIELHDVLNAQQGALKLFAEVLPQQISEMRKAKEPPRAGNK